MRKIFLILGAVILIWLAYIAASSTTASLMSKPPAAPSSVESTVVSNSPSPFGVGFAFIILVAVIFLIGFQSKKDTARETLTQPVFAALAGVIVLNALAYIFAYSGWARFWSHQTMFWGTSLSLILVVYLFSRTEKIFKRLAYGIIALVILGFLGNAKGPSRWPWDKKEDNNITVTSPSNVPVRKILWEIGGCESRGEPGGKQLNADGSTVINVNKDGSKDIGALQINDQAQADLIKNNPSLNIYKYKEDNYKLGEMIAERDKGFSAWNASKACWEPKLALLSGKPVFTPDPDVFEAPVGNYSKWVSIPLDHNAYWGRSEGAFVIENDKGVQARFDPANDIVEDLPHRNKGKVRGISRRLRAIAMGEKPGKVVIDYKPKNQ